MKKIKYILLVITVILLTGCTDKVKESIDYEYYLKTLAAFGYTMSDYSKDLDFVNHYYSYSDKEFSIMYMDADKTYDIQGLYLDECSNVNNQITKGQYVKNQSGENWSSFEAENDNYYYKVILVDKAFVSIKANKNNKELYDDILYEFGF